ncbi:MAG TPA: glycosyltransferase family 87 protein [Vicinamibacterales bacterium]|nr:glycosyltransferase family 87 protein [Vicinamibacterales bacterium]
MIHVRLHTIPVALFATFVAVASQRLHSNDFWAYYWAVTRAQTDPAAVYAPIPLDAFGGSVPPFVYAPPAILLLWPFAWFQPEAAAWFLFAASVSLGGVMAFGILPRLLSSLGVREVVVAPLVVSTFLNYPFYATLILGQINVVVGFLLLTFYVLHRRSRAFGSAACLALAIALKLFPAVLLVPLVLCRRFREAAIVVCLVTLMVVATMMVLPMRLWADWFAHVVQPGGFGRALPTLAADLLRYNVSINGTLMRILGATALTATLSILSGAIMLALSVRHQPARAVLSPLAVAGVALVTFCAAPISWVHHLAMVIPLVAVALPACATPLLWVVPYAVLCFKWDWSWGTMMLFGVAPPTIGAIVLWLRMVSVQRHSS